MALLYRPRVIISGVSPTPAYATAYFAQSGGSAEDAANIWRSLFQVASPGMSSEARVDLDTAVPVVEDTSGDIVGVLTVPVRAEISGGSNSEPLPRQVQLGINVRTNVYAQGRRIQGRFNIPGFTEPYSFNGTGPNFGQQIFADLNEHLQNAIINDANSQWMVFSPTRLTSAPVTQASVNPTWFTLRGRLR